MAQPVAVKLWKSLLRYLEGVHFQVKIVGANLIVAYGIYRAVVNA
jgi:hypothetical protein